MCSELYVAPSFEKAPLCHRQVQNFGSTLEKFSQCLGQPKRSADFEFWQISLVMLFFSGSGQFDFYLILSKFYGLFQ